MIIYIIKYSLDYCIKGINIDSDILKETIEYLKNNYKFDNFNIKLLDLKISKINHYANNNNHNDIPLDGKIYIFCETILYELFSYLLKNKKYVILVPNLDNCQIYLNNNHPLKRYNYLQLLYILKKNIFFIIWSKTIQTQKILNKNYIQNYYIGFYFYNKEPILEKKINLDILLDTGSSVSKRKYINKVIDIFKNNDIPFKLTVKTTPNIYKINKLFQYEKYKNIKIINKIVDMKTINDIYRDHSFLIYISKYDGFGLTLSKSISMGHFIFCLKGEPWIEQLNNYDRKIFIDCNYVGKHYLQNVYKADFNDLKEKLYNYKKYINIINNTLESVNNFNEFKKKNMFLNMKNFFINLK
jgi:hypothetical protein